MLPAYGVTPWQEAHLIQTPLLIYAGCSVIILNHLHYHHHYYNFFRRHAVPTTCRELEARASRTRSRSWPYWTLQPLPLAPLRLFAFWIKRWQRHGHVSCRHVSASLVIPAVDQKQKPTLGRKRAAVSALQREWGWGSQWREGVSDSGNFKLHL